MDKFNLAGILFMLGIIVIQIISLCTKEFDMNYIIISILAIIVILENIRPYVKKVE
jgi:hypothetical protein